jgi:hypothetical protein
MTSHREGAKLPTRFSVAFFSSGVESFVIACAVDGLIPAMSKAIGAETSTVLAGCPGLVMQGSRKEGSIT